jgi:hypothetical protein
VNGYCLVAVDYKVNIMARPRFEKRPEITKRVKKELENGRVLRWVADQLFITPQAFYYKLNNHNWTNGDIKLLQECGVL